MNSIYIYYRNYFLLEFIFYITFSGVLKETLGMLERKCRNDPSNNSEIVEKKVF